MKIFKNLLLPSALLLAGLFEAPGQVNITTWQADLQHSGTNPNETILTPANVGSSGSVGLLFTQPMDGQTYGQVLYAGSVNVSGTTHNIVYAATEHDSLYAFDADTNTGTNANPIWQDSFLPAGTTTVPQGDVGSGDISIELGITTTPVIDPVSSTIYIVSKVKTTTARTSTIGSDTGALYAVGTYQQYLHALDLATGAEKFGGPVLINPTFQGTSNVNGTEQTTTGVNNQTGSPYPAGTIPFNALHEHTRAAMTLYNGIVYISYASHSDTNPYHGEVIGYNASTLQFVRSFISTPNNNEAGIWGAGAGPAIDSNGNMYVTTGNGGWDQASGSPYTTGTDWGESFLKLSTSTPATGAFTSNFGDSTTFFTPNNWNNLNGGDLDIGSSGICLLPDLKDGSGVTHHLMVGGGKGQVMYVVDRDNLGGINYTKDPAVQEIPEPNAEWLFVTPAYFNNYIYYSPSGGHLEQRAVGYNAVTGGYVADPPTYMSANQFGGKGSGVFISANGTTNGIVWILNGNLQAYNAANVSNPPLFTENATVPVTNVGCQTTKFSLPMVANGKVYYTAFDNTNTGHLFVTGLLPVAPGTPAAPTNLTATATSVGQIALNWTDNSNNETGFIIKRSTGSTFVQVGTTAPNVTAYTDTGLNPATTYFYQVFAANDSLVSTGTNQASATTFPAYAPLGLIAYWNLDDANATIVADSTGNGHSGSVNGEVSSVLAGYINGAFQFHGTGFATSNITVQNSPSLQFAANQSFSLTAWVNPSNVHGVEQAILSKSADQGNEYGIYINANNQWVARGNGGDIVGPTVVQSVWTHVALVQDGVAGTRSLYVNGVLAGTGIAQAANGAGALWMGQQNISATPDSFPGLIDEVRVYNIALSPGSVISLLSPPLLRAISSQVQGSAGTFGLVLAPLSTQVVESRKGSSVGQYTIAANFAAPVSGITASLGLQGGGTAVGSVQSVSYDSTGQVVTVILTGVGNDQALNLHLAGIQPGNGTTDIPINILWGDANGDGLVNSHDVSLIANNHAGSVNSATAFYDFNCDGVIDASDDAIVSAANGTSVGSTPSDTNLALYGTPTASSSNAGNLASYAFDGNSATRWESAQGVDPQSISVDLGQISTIHSIILNWETASGATYNLNVSNDGVNWTTVVAVGTNAPGAVLTLPANVSVNPNVIRTYSGLNVTGRYVQMAGVTRTTGYGYSLYEFQVIGAPATPLGSGPVPVINTITSTTGKQGAPFSYQVTATNSPTSFAATGLPAGLSLNTTTGLISGTPTSSGTSTVNLTATNANGTSAVASLSLNMAANSDVTSGDTNLALGKTAIASSVNGANVAANAVDGNTGTRWESTQGIDPQYIVIDLGQVSAIHSIVLNWEPAAGSNYTLDTSTDGETWGNVVTVTGNTSSGPLTYGGLSATGRYVRMYGTTRDSPYGYSLWEFQVFGVAGSSTPSFAAQPTSQTASASQPVTFTATASGTGPFSYQWQFNGTNIPGATGSTYSIPSVSSANYGNYLVVITNAYGSITSNYFTLGLPSANGPSDTPTMPLWALVILALLLLGMGQRFLPQNSLRRM